MCVCLAIKFKFHLSVFEKVVCVVCVGGDAVSISVAACVLNCVVGITGVVVV